MQAPGMVVLGNRAVWVGPRKDAGYAEHNLRLQGSTEIILYYAPYKMAPATKQRLVNLNGWC